MAKISNKKSMKEIEEAFDAGESILKFAKKGKIEVKQQTQKINVNFPLWMIEALDKESHKLAVDRQAVIKMILNEVLATKGYSAQEKT